MRSVTQFPQKNARPYQRPQPATLGLVTARSAHATATHTVVHEKYFAAEANSARLAGAREPHFVDMAREAREGGRSIDALDALQRNAEETARRGSYAPERDWRRVA